MAILFNIDEALKNKAGFNLLQEPFKMLFTNEVEAFEKNSVIGKIFTTLKLDSFQEEFRTKTSMDGFEPGADMEPAKLSDFQEGYSQVFRAVTWRNSFVVSKQTIEDSQMGQINADAVGFIQSYGRTKEQFAAKILGGALTGSATFGKYTFDCKGMDTISGVLDTEKQKYFHKSHVSPVFKNGSVDSSLTQSNKFAINEDLSFSDSLCRGKIASVIGQVETKMINYTDYKGNPIPHNPSVIVMGTDYKFKNALLQALAERNGSSITEVNDFETKVGKWTIISTPYLDQVSGFTASDLGIVLIDPVANARDKGIVWVDRKELELSSYYEELNEANVWKGRSRFSAGFGDFRCAAYITFKAESGNATTTPITPNDVTGKPVDVVNTVSTKEVASA